MFPLHSVCCFCPCLRVTTFGTPVRMLSPHHLGQCCIRVSSTVLPPPPPPPYTCTSQYNLPYTTRCSPYTTVLLSAEEVNFTCSYKYKRPDVLPVQSELHIHTAHTYTHTHMHIQHTHTPAPIYSVHLKCLLCMSVYITDQSLLCSLNRKCP